MKKIVIATNNKNKIKEISQILKLDDTELLSLSDLNIDFDVDETGLTFKKNAEKKAVEYYELCKLPVIAEDSGLEIKALNGLPGVFSKRIYEGKSEFEGNEIILDNLKDIKDRSASYVASYCYYDGDKKIFAEGRTYGKIAFEQEGENGFAYDRIFLSDNLNKLLSKATDEEKNSISHRKKGLEKLKNLLEGRDIDTDYVKKGAFKHKHFYKSDSFLHGNSHSIYQFIDKKANDFKSNNVPYTCFIDIDTDEILAEDFLGSDFLIKIPLTPIEDCEFSTGLYNSLKRGGINFKEEIEFLWDKERLSRIKGFGSARFKELNEKNIKIKNK